MFLVRTFATRRMWIKRFRNAAFVLSILAMPLQPLVWLFQYVRWYTKTLIYGKRGSDEFFGASFLNIAILIGAILTGLKIHSSQPVSTAELTELRRADSCFDDTIVRRAALWQRVITRGDVMDTQNDCAQYWAKEASKKALANQLGQPKN